MHNEHNGRQKLIADAQHVNKDVKRLQGVKKTKLQRHEKTSDVERPQRRRPSFKMTTKRLKMAAERCNEAAPARRPSSTSMQKMRDGFINLKRSRAR